MRKADIVIGEVYAMAENYHWNGGYRGHDHQKATKVKVIATGLIRGRTRSFGSQTRDGVSVELLASPLNTMRCEAGSKMIVRSADIRELWSTFESRALEQQAARKQSKADADATALRLIDEITMALPEDFIIPEGALPKQRHDGSWSKRPELTFDQLIALMDAAAVHVMNGGLRQS